MTAMRLVARKVLVCSRSSIGQRVDDAVHGLRGAGGVQGAEHQVPGFGGGHRHGNGFGIAQLADQNHVRVFAHRGAHAFGKGGQVRAQFTLNDLAGLAAVNEFYRGLPG